MWNQSNWCEKIILLSSGILLLSFLCNTIFYPSFGIWLVFYSSALIISSVWLTCYEIQYLLNQCEPLKTNSSGIFTKIIQSRHVSKIISTIIPSYGHRLMLRSKKSDTPEDIADTKNACIISSVIERKCIWSWYSNYVSKEIAFPFACKELFDQMLIKGFQILTNVNAVNLTSDSAGIILRHLKEYKRSMKRLEKSKKGSIDECYRKFHPTSTQRGSNTITNKAKSTQNYCLSLIKIFLKELLPWELWDTPHAILIASILAKRLDNFIINNLSDPIWLRNWTMQLLTENVKKNTEINHDSHESKDPVNNAEIPISTTKTLRENNDPIPKIKETDLNESNTPPVLKTSIESALSNMISNSTAPILQRAEIEAMAPKSVLSIIPNIHIEKKNNTITQPINIAGTINYEFGHSPNIKKKNTGEVKVYDRLLDGSLKTWNNDMDLECVSLGQDLLASIDGEMGFESRLGRLWEADAPEAGEIWSPNPPSSDSSAKLQHGLWFGEEDNLDMELTEESPPKNTVQINTPSTYPNFSITKPLGIQNMKELQNISKTVNQAKNRIGDLQDEAAGVMEGILDLGIAGFKKGLRLTGLQESLNESKEKNVLNSLKPSNEQQSNNLVAVIGQALTSSRKNSQSDEAAIKFDTSKIISAIKKDDSDEKTNAHSQPLHLVKQHRVTSQDSESTMKIENIPIRNGIEEPIDPLISIGDSPDYEYEEVEDFASTIAKLRCLLQQKTGDITPVPGEEALNIKSDKEKCVPSDLNISPAHKPVSRQNETKSEELFSVSSIESENGFTILSSSVDFIEAEEAINQKSFPSEMLLPENNIQRLDKLFTRTVTGVFNSIKTAVGGDSASDVFSSQTDISNALNDKHGVITSISSKDNWIFTKGNVDLSMLVSRLLIERRGYCIVEAAQDSLETISGVSNYQTNASEGETPVSVQDDLDETEINKCPLWHMCIEIISVVLGGVMQKDVVIKCASIATSEKVEKILQDNLEHICLNLKGKIIDVFRNLYMTSESPPNINDQIEVDIDTLCDEIIKLFPELLFTILGKNETQEALQMIFSSVDHQLINRDLIFNLLDVFVLHFLKASAVPATGSNSTPPPSA